MGESILNKFNFLKNKRVLLILAAAVLLLIPILALSLSSNRTPFTQKAGSSRPVNSNPKMSPTRSPADDRLPIPTGLHFQQETISAWGAVTLSENDLQGVSATKEILKDGSTQYTFDSPNLKRPDMILVDRGTIVFTRQILLDTKTESYVFAYGKPVHISRAPTYYGPGSLTYIYPAQGLAFTADPKTNLVFEQFIFKPTTIEDFNLRYKEYLQ